MASTTDAATKLAAIMKDEGRSATWLARRVDMTLPMATRTIRGERQPTLGQAYAIAAALRRDVADVFDVFDVDPAPSAA